MRSLGVGRGCGISLMPSKTEDGDRHSSEAHSKRTTAASGRKVNSCWIWRKLFWQWQWLSAGRGRPALLWHPCQYSKLAWTANWWTSSNFAAGLALSRVLDHITSSGLSQPEQSCDSRYVQHPPFPLLGVIETGETCWPGPPLLQHQYVWRSFYQSDKWGVERAPWVYIGK